MKHVKRSDCRTQARGAIMEYYYDMIEAEVLQNQIDQAWDAKEASEADRIKREADRIKRETDASWKEYEAYKEALDKECNTNATTEIEEYFQSLEETARFEASFHLMKDKKRSGRRRENAYAKRRLLTKAENARKNLLKRDECDWNNFLFHASEGIKSRVVRYNALEKKAKKLQP